jgi:ABC-type multidrug transport system ATPase subunit
MNELVEKNGFNAVQVTTCGEFFYKFYKFCRMLILRNIQKKYGASTILNIENLELSHGIYWLKGGNGSGKTTLFKMLAGLIPFNGQIQLNDLDIIA